jgi:hypothetical protein
MKRLGLAAAAGGAAFALRRLAAEVREIHGQCRDMMARAAAAPAPPVIRKRRAESTNHAEARPTTRSDESARPHTTRGGTSTRATTAAA